MRGESGARAGRDAAPPPDGLAIALAAAATRGDAVRVLAQALRAVGIADAGTDAGLLVAHALGCARAALVLAPGVALDDDARARIAELGRRRLGREPVSRIIGRRWFFGLELEIGPATLDPRPDTETLVEGVLLRLRQRAERTADARAPRILDLGTGSGAVLIALLAALPAATGLGTDCAEAALAVARRNAERLGVMGRAAFRRSDWLSGLAGERFDVIVANPPYIARGDIAGLDPEVRCFDPLAALDGGEDGLVAYRAICASISNHLMPGGVVAFEVGADQAGAVATLMRAAGLDPEPPSEMWQDLSRHVRCVAGWSRIAG